MTSFEVRKREQDALIAGVSSSIFSVRSGAFPLEGLFRSLAYVADRDPDLMQSEWVAAAAWILTQCEVGEGGPYRSRIGSQDEPDLETNVQIARFLRTQDIVLNPLNEWLAKQGVFVLQEKKR